MRGRDHTLENADRGRLHCPRTRGQGHADEYQALLNCGWPPLGPWSGGSPGGTFGNAARLTSGLRLRSLWPRRAAMPGIMPGAAELPLTPPCAFRAAWRKQHGKPESGPALARRVRFPSPSLARLAPRGLAFVGYTVPGRLAG